MAINRFAVVAGLILLTGCNSFSNGRSPFSPAHQLTPEAKAVKQKFDQPDVPRELNKRVIGPYLLEPGDVVLIQPADPESTLRLPGDQPILPDGTIQLGRFGKLMIAGKTTEEIELAARELIKSQTKESSAVTVRIVSRVSKVFYVLGQVNSPGAFQYTGRETVLDAIVASAGGLTDGASRKHIIVSRPTAPGQERIIMAVCYHDIVQLGDVTTNYQLMPGDRVYVPSKSVKEMLGCDKGH